MAWKHWLELAGTAGMHCWQALSSRHWLAGTGLAYTRLADNGWQAFADKHWLADTGLQALLPRIGWQTLACRHWLAGACCRDWLAGTG